MTLMGRGSSRWRVVWMLLANSPEASESTYSENEDYVLIYNMVTIVPTATPKQSLQHCAECPPGTGMGRPGKGAPTCRSSTP